MDKIEFEVQGSSPDPYRVTFKKTDNNLTATCTCLAGEKGQSCKHRLRIIAGDSIGIVSGNADAVAEIKKWAQGSDVEAAINKLREAEQKLEEAKAYVTKCKHAVSYSLMN